MLNFSLWKWKHNEMNHTGVGDHTMAGQVPVFQSFDFLVYMFVDSTYNQFWLYQNLSCIKPSGTQLLCKSGGVCAPLCCFIIHHCGTSRLIERDFKSSALYYCYFWHGNTVVKLLSISWMYCFSTEGDSGKEGGNNFILAHIVLQVKGEAIVCNSESCNIYAHYWWPDA